jgi:hypothetical protein
VVRRENATEKDGVKMKRLSRGCGGVPINRGRRRRAAGWATVKRKSKKWVEQARARVGGRASPSKRCRNARQPSTPEILAAFEGKPEEDGSKTLFPPGKALAGPNERPTNSQRELQLMPHKTVRNDLQGCRWKLAGTLQLDRASSHCVAPSPPSTTRGNPGRASSHPPPTRRLIVARRSNCDFGRRKVFLFSSEFC